MLPPVQQTLQASAAVTALTGTRIDQGIAPEGTNATQADFVVWQMISNVPELNMADLPEEDDQLVQVDCYSKSLRGARALALAVRDALEAQTHVVRGPEWSYEADTKLHRYSMDAEYWLSRTGDAGVADVPISIPFGGVKTGDFNVDSTSRAYTINVTDPATATASLPPAASCAGAIYLFDLVSDGAVSIAPSGSDTIEGSASPFNLNNNAIFYSDGISNFIKI